jgi:hypothetical protein
MRGVNLEAITALSALQAGSDVLVLRHPKTLWHVRKYLSEIMLKTDLDTMGVDLSLVAPLESAAVVAAVPTPLVAKHVPTTEAIPATQARQEPQPGAAAELTRPTESTAVDVETAPAQAATPSRHQETETSALSKASISRAKPRTTAGSEPVELTDADIEALRELLGAFRAIKNLVAAISNLASGDVKHAHEHIHAHEHMHEHKHGHEHLEDALAHTHDHSGDHGPHDHVHTGHECEVHQHNH